LEIKDLQPGQKVFIVDEEASEAVEIEEVGENYISVRSLVGRVHFTYFQKDIKKIRSIESMEGKTVLAPVISVKCPIKQELVPTTDCFNCERFSRKTFEGSIICKTTIEQ